jgi:hypothetical protein
MKRSDVNVENLLNQLSEEKINLVVSQDAVYAEGTTCNSNEGSSTEDGGGIGVVIGVGGGIGIGL